jgi:hypothetical protein
MPAQLTMLSEEKRLQRLRRVLHFLETRIPRIILRRFDWAFPALKKSVYAFRCGLVSEMFVIGLVYIEMIFPRNLYFVCPGDFQSVFMCAVNSIDNVMDFPTTHFHINLTTLL